MKRVLLSIILIGCWSMALNAESNKSAETRQSPESNKSTESNNSQKTKKMKEQIEKQLEKEKKYAKEKAFYQGEDYDLESHEVDPDSLSDIPYMEPQYDFDMSEGVYTD